VVTPIPLGRRASHHLPRALVVHSEAHLSREDQDFRTGCQLLIARTENARDQVTVVFLGLFAFYSDNLERLTTIVRLLQTLPSEATAQRLFAEFRRVKSNNTTRAYLSVVLDTLAQYPSSLTGDPS
jgi:hypothetical protein